LKQETEVFYCMWTTACCFFSMCGKLVVNKYCNSMKENISPYSSMEAEAKSMQGLVDSGEAPDYTSAEKKIEREKFITDMNEKIEEARKNGLIENETANLTAAALKMEGEDALFANRVVSRGSDPASLELALTGQISEPVMRAHRMGPGSLSIEEREAWLVLASVSIDEHAAADISVTKKFEQFHESLKWLETATDEAKKAAAEEELKKILAIPYEEEDVRGVKMRVYTSDRGFAAAYWSGEGYAAVKEGELTFVGSQEQPLEEIGVKVDKQLSPTFGIIFEKK